MPVRLHSPIASFGILSLGLAISGTATGCLSIGGRTVYEDQETSQKVKVLEQRISQLEHEQALAQRISKLEQGQPAGGNLAGKVEYLDSQTRVFQAGGENLLTPPPSRPR